MTTFPPREGEGGGEKGVAVVGSGCKGDEDSDDPVTVVRRSEMCRSLIEHRGEEKGWVQISHNHNHHRHNPATLTVAGLRLSDHCGNIQAGLEEKNGQHISSSGMMEEPKMQRNSDKLEP